MNQINIRYHNMAIGEVVLSSFQNRLCFLDFRERNGRAAIDYRIGRALKAELVEQDDEVLAKTCSQLDEYLEGHRARFDIPLLMVGTDFQKRVWNALMGIPYGATATYGQIAQGIGNARAFRAVGNACGANPISIIVPCHRVIGRDRQLVGYGGGLSLKERLLELERSYVSTLARYGCGVWRRDDIAERPGHLRKVI
jgi:methylated-DNA-[protein]-cysteine S-methyltransferase